MVQQDPPNPPSRRSVDLRDSRSSALDLILGERRPGARSLSAPVTIDLSLTGRCQLRCAWCWGTEQAVGEIHAVELWLALLDELAARGTRHVVITGGEPFLSSYLEPVLEQARRVGLRITLSTNGIVLSRQRDSRSLLAYVDDLGIPIDGHTPEVNAAMRRRSGSLNGWQRAVTALKLAQEIVPSITVRTVIARKNIDSVPLIPAALERQGVDVSLLRFKAYQVEPIGPHWRATDWAEWQIDAEAVQHDAEAMLTSHPDLLVTVQLYQNTAGRYFRIDPDGRAFGTDFTTDGTPEEIGYGNVIENLEQALATWRAHKRSPKARNAHAWH